MCDIVKDYFTELFAGDVDCDEIDQIAGHRSVTREQNLKLTEDLSF